MPQFDDSNSADSSYENNFQDSIEDQDSQETFSFLYATDIHLGYSISQTIESAKNDSFTAFEEILQKFSSEKADCLLLGGDLFHSPHPNMHERILLRNLLQNYVHKDVDPEALEGEQAQNNQTNCSFSLMSDPLRTFVNKVPTFESTKFNIKMPILSIYGNHDEPLADGNCIIDEYPEYINLIGKRMDKLFAVDADYKPKNNLSSTKIKRKNKKEELLVGEEVDMASTVNIYPTVLNKNGIKVAIYAISYLRPEVIEHVKFKFHKVKVRNPETKKTESLVAFNICILHQDRFRDSIGLFDRNLIPEWMDVVLWGHEHQCRINPDCSFEVETFKVENRSSVRNRSVKQEIENSDEEETGPEYRSLNIIQPGSPIPTSLSESEAGSKYISKISINIDLKAKYKVVELTSIRKFKFYKMVCPADNLPSLEKIVRQVKKELDDEGISESKPGYIRLRYQSEFSAKQIKAEGVDLINVWLKLSDDYKRKIANPNNFIMYRKKAPVKKKFNNLMVEINDLFEGDEADEKANVLADDLKDMMGVTSNSLNMLEQEAKNRNAGVNSLMENITAKLLSKSRDYPLAIDPNDFMESLGHAESLNQAQFVRDMQTRLSDIVKEKTDSYRRFWMEESERIKAIDEDSSDDEDTMDEEGKPHKKEKEYDSDCDMNENALEQKVKKEIQERVKNQSEIWKGIISKKYSAMTEKSEEDAEQDEDESLQACKKEAQIIEKLKNVAVSQTVKNNSFAAPRLPAPRLPQTNANAKKPTQQKTQKTQPIRKTQEKSKRISSSSEDEIIDATELAEDIENVDPEENDCGFLPSSVASTGRGKRNITQNSTSTRNKTRSVAPKVSQKNNQTIAISDDDSEPESSIVALSTIDLKIQNNRPRPRSPVRPRRRRELAATDHTDKFIFDKPEVQSSSVRTTNAMNETSTTCTMSEDLISQKLDLTNCMASTMKPSKKRAKYDNEVQPTTSTSQRLSRRNRNSQSQKATQKMLEEESNFDFG